jgi:predicted amidohydrolase YtcJ
VIDRGLIGDDNENAQEVSGGGGVLLPGLIDAHVHLYTERELRLMAEFGVTTALDMATWLHSKLSALRGRVGMTSEAPGYQ